MSDIECIRTICIISYTRRDTVYTYECAKVILSPRVKQPWSIEIDDGQDDMIGTKRHVTALSRALGCELILLRYIHRIAGAEAFPGNELLITGARNASSCKSIADHVGATRNVSRRAPRVSAVYRVASRRIASRGAARGISKTATFVHPRLHARGHFCDAPLGSTLRAEDSERGKGGRRNTRFDPKQYIDTRTDH